MIIRKTDYSPLYNALRTKGAAEQTGFTAQSIGLQKEGFKLQRQALDLNTGLGIAQTALSAVNTIVDFGTKAYGMYVAQKSAEAENDVLKIQPQLEQMRIDMVANGKYSPVETPEGPSMQLNGDFDTYVQQQIAEISGKYSDTPSVQTYVENSMLKLAASQKNAATGQIAQKAINDRETLSAQTRTQVVQNAISTGAPELIKEQINAEWWRTPEEKQILINNSMIAYDDGAKKKTIMDTMHMGGLTEALKTVDAMQLDPDRAIEYKAFATKIYDAEQKTYAAQAKEIGDRIETAGGSPYDAAVEILNNDNIPESYRMDYAREYRFQGDTGTMKDVLRSEGYDAAMQYIESANRHYTGEEVARQKANLYLADKQETINVDRTWSTAADKVVEAGQSPASLYAAVDKANMPTEYKEVAKNAVEKREGQWIADGFEEKYGTIKYDLESLNSYKAEIQADIANRYERFPETRVDHLDRLDRQIAALTPKEPSGADKTSAFNQWANTAWMGLRDGSYSAHDIFREMTSPGTYANTVMMDGGAGVRSFIDNVYEYAEKSDPKAAYVKAKAADFDKLVEGMKGYDDAYKNEIKAGYARAMFNEIQTNQNASTADLDKVSADYMNLTVGKAFDALSAHVEARGGVDAGKSKAQVWDIQKMIDNSTIEVTTDTQGNVEMPSVTKTDYDQFVQAQRRMLSERLQTDATYIDYMSGTWSGDYQNMLEGFTPGKGDRVSLQPLYVYHDPNGNERKYTIRAGEKGQYHIYEAITKDGQTVFSEVTINQPADLPPMAPPQMDETTQKLIDQLNLGGFQTEKPATAQPKTETQQRQEDLRKRFPGVNF